MITLRQLTRVAVVASRKHFVVAVNQLQQYTCSQRLAMSHVSARTGHLSAVCTELGKPLVIEAQNSPPTPDEGQVKIAVHSASINFSDILTCAGLYQEKPPVPFIPGAEMSGEVIELGPGVSDLKVGDRVCGMVQGTGSGAFSQQTIVYSQTVHKIPESVSYKAASAVLCIYGTAWMGLVRRANIKPGDVVLITAAAGGVGLAAVDLAANSYGATVIGACGGPEKGKVVKQAGAHYVIDYKTENIKDRVNEITDDHGADIVFEAVGGEVFKQAMKCIAHEGRLLIIGFAGGDIPKIPANHLLVKSCSAVGLYWGAYSMRNPAVFRESVHEVLKLLEQGKIKPHISASYPLHKINEAFKFVQGRQSTGKVLIDMQQSVTSKI